MPSEEADRNKLALVNRSTRYADASAWPPAPAIPAFHLRAGEFHCDRTDAGRENSSAASSTGISHWLRSSRLPANRSTDASPLATRRWPREHRDRSSSDAAIPHPEASSIVKGMSRFRSRNLPVSGLQHPCLRCIATSRQIKRRTVSVRPKNLDARECTKSFQEAVSEYPLPSHPSCVLRTTPTSILRLRTLSTIKSTYLNCLS